MTALPPLRLTPRLVEKPWGGVRLGALGRTLPPGILVGESWDLVDLDPQMTPVPDPVSRVCGGPLDGTPLRDLVRSSAADLLGPALVGADRFPLLVKHLDAREHLSVQVHPTASVVADYPGSYLKTESWVVVAAGPRSELMLGLAPGTTPGAVEAALGGPDIVPLVRRVPARVGDVHHLPPGLVHAVGAGVVVAEVETPSDTTFRLYDWTREYGRAPRDLHTAQAMASIRSAWEVNMSPPAPVGHDGLVVRSDAYTITRRTTPAAQTVTVAPRPVVRIVLALAGRLAMTGLDEDLRAGELAILPACWDGEVTSEPATTWLDIDVVAPA